LLSVRSLFISQEGGDAGSRSVHPLTCTAPSDSRTAATVVRPRTPATPARNNPFAANLSPDGALGRYRAKVFRGGLPETDFKRSLRGPTGIFRILIGPFEDYAALARTKLSCRH